MLIALTITRSSLGNDHGPWLGVVGRGCIASRTEDRLDLTFANRALHVKSVSAMTTLKERSCWKGTTKDYVSVVCSTAGSGYPSK